MCRYIPMEGLSGGVEKIQAYPLAPSCRQARIVTPLPEHRAAPEVILVFPKNATTKEGAVDTSGGLLRTPAMAAPPEPPRGSHNTGEGCEDRGQLENQRLHRKRFGESVQVSERFNGRDPSCSQCYFQGAAHIK